MNKSLLFILAAFAFLSSCQKEVEGELEESDLDPRILGVWNFKGMNIDFTSIQESNLLGTETRTVSTNKYSSTNNGGTVTITGNRMEGKDLTYAVNYEINSDYYVDGIYDYSDVTPFSFSVSEYNSSANIVQAGTDSLYMPNGAFMSVGQDTTGLQGEPEGTKYRIEGNRLIFYNNNFRRETQTEFAGMVISMVTTGKNEMILERP